MEVIPKGTQGLCGRRTESLLKSLWALFWGSIQFQKASHSLHTCINSFVPRNREPETYIESVLSQVYSTTEMYWFPVFSLFDSPLPSKTFIHFLQLLFHLLELLMNIFLQRKDFPVPGEDEVEALPFCRQKWSFCCSLPLEERGGGTQQQRETIDLEIFTFIKCMSHTLIK